MFLYLPVQDLADSFNPSRPLVTTAGTEAQAPLELKEHSPEAEGNESVTVALTFF